MCFDRRGCAMVTRNKSSARASTSTSASRQRSTVTTSRSTSGWRRTNARSRSRRAGVRLAWAMRSTRIFSRELCLIFTCGNTAACLTSRFQTGRRRPTFNLRDQSSILFGGLVSMPLRLGERVNARGLGDEPNHVVSIAERHSPMRVHAVAFLPHRP